LPLPTELERLEADGMVTSVSAEPFVPVEPTRCLPLESAPAVRGASPLKKRDEADEDGSVDDVKPVEEPPPEPEPPEPDPPVVEVEFLESPEPEPEPLSPDEPEPDFDSSPPDEPLSWAALVFLAGRREAAG
jgi:hypothetical protein